MALCKLCQEREANKKNTHYLTDAVIRTCLNIDGVNEREKGLYFALNNSNPFIDFNFQRLDELTLERTIGRKPNEDEIEKAKSIPFSVDYVFCSDCENLFTGIENPFINNILPNFRSGHLRDFVEEQNSFAVRSFFYLQIYRSAVCEDILNLSEKFVEKLRNIILTKIEDKSIPLSITYLQTLGGEKNYTQNFIGFTSDKDPYIIFMNDFVIQVYEAPENIHFLPFNGLNNENSYHQFINYEENFFLFNVFEDNKRKKLLHDVIVHEKVEKTLQQYRNMFDMFWVKLFGTEAPLQQRERYIQALINGDDKKAIKYTKEQVFDFTVKYLAKLFEIKE